MLRALSVCVLMVVPMAAMAQDHAGHAEHAGYVELEDREIKALSAERVGALRDGEGAGYALAAELNKYPGPRHALDLRDDLELTDEQYGEIARIHDEMNHRARRMGHRLVEMERELDREFRDRSVTEERLRELLRSIAELEADIRYIHLEAHLRTTRLLTHEQILRYQEARGYGHEPGMRR